MRSASSVSVIRRSWSKSSSLTAMSILKTGKARAIRFSTLEAICSALDCQPGDILRFEHDGAEPG